MTTRSERESKLRVENRRLKAALSGVHDRLHAGDIDGAHEQCECALNGGNVSQPNLHAADAAAGMDFAVAFNALADTAKVRACCVMLVPSATHPGHTSIQLCGEVLACKVIEDLLRGEPSIYMGDHAAKQLDAELTALTAMRGAAKKAGLF